MRRNLANDTEDRELQPRRVSFARAPAIRTRLEETTEGTEELAPEQSEPKCWLLALRRKRRKQRQTRLRTRVLRHRVERDGVVQPLHKALRPVLQRDHRSLSVLRCLRGLCALGG